MCKCSKEIVVGVFKEDKDMPIPEYKYVGDIGFDLRSTIDVDVYPMNVLPIKISTGLRFQIPFGYCLKIYSRSGISADNHVLVSNGVGCIDHSYTGVVSILLTNLGENIFKVKRGDRIAQGAIEKIPIVKLIEVDKIEKTERGDGGFGSTGIK